MKETDCLKQQLLLLMTKSMRNWTNEIPFTLEDGQIIATIIYEKLTSKPLKIYGNKKDILHDNRESRIYYDPEFDTSIQDKKQLDHKN